MAPAGTPSTSTGWTAEENGHRMAPGILHVDIRGLEFVNTAAEAAWYQAVRCGARLYVTGPRSFIHNKGRLCTANRSLPMAAGSASV